MAGSPFFKFEYYVHVPTFQIVTSEVTEWAKAYSGGKFHALFSDFPYDIGFMGKQWDKNAQFKTWGESLLPHLLPGAPALIFGGTRSWHRLAVAMEDAGFELFDTMMWVYGCLSEDTELLVDGEWVPYYEASKGRKTLGYNTQNDTFDWMPIEELYIYGYKDTAFRIQSNYTDQIVSRNHRCIVERDGKKIFQFAEEAAQEQEICVPILEDVQGVLTALQMRDSGSSAAECDLLESIVPAESNSLIESTQTTGTSQWNGTDSLCGLRNPVMESAMSFKAYNRTDMLPLMQWQTPFGWLETPFGEGEEGLDGRKPSFIHRENVRQQEPRLEGRRDLFSQARQLQARKVCKMPAGVCGYGEEGRVYNGAPTYSCESHRSDATTRRSRTSRKSRSSGQPIGESLPVQEQLRTQDLRMAGFTRATMARITPIPYEGKVWCVKVPTGAFVARRNGKVFVTGNSGFPKGQDISKLIDKRNGDGRGSEQSRPWVGHKTMALKPAWEPILCFRKAMEGTYAETALSYGSGALNIDGARISLVEGVDDSQLRTMKRSAKTKDDGWGMNNRSADEPQVVNPNGRYPANFTLQCICETTEIVEVPQHGAVSGEETSDSTKNTHGKYQRKPFTPHAGVALAHTNPDCPAAMLDAQSGITKSGAMKHEVGAYEGESVTPLLRGRSGPSNQHGDAGGASRFFYCAKTSTKERNAGVVGENHHPTLKPITLTTYIAKLLLPPASVGTRRILVPFAGSGSEMIGCLLAGWEEVVGVEMMPEYVTIAQQRCAHALNGGKFAEKA